MKLVVKTLVFHILCIIFFALLYSLNSKDFVIEYKQIKQKYPEFIDFIFLSSTIQSGIGFNFLIPTNNITKILIILQQFTIISSYVFVLYFFTL